MIKKILIYAGYVFVMAIFAAYFFFASTLTAKESSVMVCKEMKIVILDSIQNRFVNREEISDILNKAGVILGQSKVNEINHHQLENLLNNKTAIKVSQVSVTTQGTLAVDIMQRKPILRLQTENGGFYIDDNAYIFPLIKNYSSYVPVVTGHIPLNIPTDYRGEIIDDTEWSKNMLELGFILEKEEFWSTMIEQIYVDRKGRLLFTPRIGMVDIIFGKPENIRYKFEKLRIFYDGVIAHEGWDKYASVDISFSNQLVCKIRNNKQPNN